MRPRVINVDEQATNRPAIAELQESGVFGPPVLMPARLLFSDRPRARTARDSPLVFYRTLGQGLPTRNAGLAPLRGAYFCTRPVRTSAV